jgi:hypothetical protein
MAKESGEFSPAEIAKRRDDAIRRALNTPHSPTRDLVGKTERAKQMREAKRRRAEQKDGEAS